MGAPADAVRDFLRALAHANIAGHASHIRADIAALRRAFSQDEDFAEALRALTCRVSNLSSDAPPLDHVLKGWLRVKFRSGLVDYSDLRSSFDPMETDSSFSRSDIAASRSRFFRASDRS